MLVTKQEADKKWCPVIGAQQPAHPVGLRVCITSDCMAWREKGSKRVAAPEYPCSDGKEGCDACTPEYSGKHIDEYAATGYCGLAGKPEVA